MKTLFKILAIFVVAVLVGGMFYGIVSAVSSGTDQSSIAERPTDGEFAPRPDHEGETGGIQFPADALKNLAIISIVGAIYLNVPRLFGKKKPVLQVAR